VNPLWKVEEYLTNEAEERRPMTAHMFATGVAIYDPELLLPELQRAAKEILTRLPVPDLNSVTQLKYGAATMLEDALDLFDRDPDSAGLLLGAAVIQLAVARMEAEPGWMPRWKDLLTALFKVDPEAGRLVVAASGSGSLEERIRAARQLSVRITGAEGFFEWSSNRESLTPSA
jgi:hypothetical protein